MVGDEVGYLAVGVACDVLDGTCAVGAFVETRYRYDGEYLVDSPGVGQGLEE